MIEIQALNRYNWEEVLKLKLADDQQEFMPDVLFSLAQSKFDPNCTPYGIEKNGEMVGFAMVCNWNGVCWISRIMVDKDRQQEGIGSSALRQLARQLSQKKGCAEVRTTISRENIWAQYVFSQTGFEPIGEDEKEVVMRLVNVPH